MPNILYYQLKLLFFKNDSIRNFIFHPHIIRHFPPFSTTTTQLPTPKNSSMVDYLVNSCGFTRDKAHALSSNLTHLNNPEKPVSVITFLKHSSLSDTQIRNLITQKPKLLCARVDRTLKPKFRVFQDLGMSASDIAKMISKNPIILHISADRQILPCIDFLRTILLNNENIIKALNRWSVLISCNPQKKLLPKISFLQRCGVPKERIAMLITKNPGIITQRSNWLEEVVERVMKLGVAMNTNLFVYAVLVVGQMSKSTMEAKFEVLKSFGWSETDIRSAFQSHPLFLTFSKTKLRQKMDFLSKEVKIEPLEIALYPQFLSLSAEKRIIPRRNLMQILKSNKLVKRDYSLFSLFFTSEKNFSERFVIPYKDKIPDVCEAYMRTVGVRLPSMES